jgi:hypothetical protein
MPRQISALTEQLALMCGDHTTSRNSLRELVTSAIDSPGKHLPANLQGVSLPAKLGWISGFSEAMHVVLKHIDSATPTPRHGPRKKQH